MLACASDRQTQDKLSFWQKNYFVLFSYTGPSPASIISGILLQSIVFATEVIVEWYSTQENTKWGVIGIEVYHLKAAYTCNTT